MKEYYEKYITEADLIKRIKEKGVPEKILAETIDKFAQVIKENHDFEGYSQNEIAEEIDEWIDYCINFISELMEKIEIGYSKEFAKLILLNIFSGQKAIADSYNQLKKENPEQANQDLEVYFKNSECDKICIEYCDELLEEGKGYFDVTRFTRAQKYSKIYNKAILKVESVEFAKLYAKQRVDLEGDSKIYCKCFAKYLLEAKTANKSGYLAELYADKISVYFEKKYKKFKNIKYEEDDLLFVQKIRTELLGIDINGKFIL